MLDVFDTAAVIAKKLTQGRFAFDKWLTPDVFAVDHQQVEGCGDRVTIVKATVKQIELHSFLSIETDHLRIDDG